MKILFVDDEPMILSGIERTLFDSEWDVVCANGGEEALSVIRQDSIDVIVSDMRMPGMSGAELLERVCTISPATARIILSGHADESASIKASLVAHYWLDKPCDQEELIRTLEHVEYGLNRLPSEEIRSSVGKIKNLPSPPKMFCRIQALIGSGSASVDKITDIIAEDPALTAKLLQLTNSSFFSRGSVISDVKEAVVRLGLDVVGNVLLVAEAYSGVPENSLFNVRDQQVHSLLIAQLASQIVEPGLEQEAMLAGLLHEIGKSILVLTFPKLVETYRSQQLEAPELDEITIEEKIYNTNHAQLGGYLLFLWGFSGEVVDGVTNHHAPNKLLGADFGVAAAIYVADSLIHKGNVDEDFIEHFKIQDSLPKWKEISEQIQL